MDEFDLIRTFLAPLANSPGADRLADDVAEIRSAGRMAATADAIVEGVHFLRNDPIETIASKLVRVNASDLIAKGAIPSECLLSLVWPKRRSANQIPRFADGLKANLDLWNCRLIGGDTTSTTGPLVLSLTMLGVCGSRGPVRRSGARAGDDVWVSGSIGDGWLGLKAALGELEHASDADRDWLVAGYREPRVPPVDLAALIAEHGGGAIDLSDGLAADAGHLAEGSGIAIRIYATQIPLSEAASRVLEHQDAVAIEDLMCGGDDYQSLFTASPSARVAIEEAAEAASLRLTRIGVCEEGEGAHFLKADGSEMALTRGWRHEIGT